MKTILVQFKRGEKIYTYNTSADVKIGDIVKTDYLDSECTIIDLINDSKYEYISASTGELKKIMTNVKDVKIKFLDSVSCEVITKHTMRAKRGF